MTTLPTALQDTMKKFDDKFSFLGDISVPIGGASYGLKSIDCADNIKSFLQSSIEHALEVQREEIIKELENLKWKYAPQTGMASEEPEQVRTVNTILSQAQEIVRNIQI